ncbi:tetratricopeptide repeat protein [Candidatus Woesearchaeota archaeon]|nr:tetratricopeptide repeat protein [Candidatus Woesearchaeota archaeon]
MVSAQSTGEYKPKYQTIAQKFILSEKGLVSDYKVGAALKRLDDIIDEALKRIGKEVKIKDSRLVSRNSTSNALDILQAINDVFEYRRFGNKANNLFSEGLLAGNLDCENRAYVYLAIAELLDLPMTMVRAPEHTFIRWEVELGRSINWETTSGERAEDRWYRRTYGISGESIDKGIYMRNLSREEVFCHQYNTLSVVWFDKGNGDKAVEFIGKSVELCSDYPGFLINMAAILSQEQRYDEIVKHCTNAIKLNPEYSIAYEKRGIAWLRLNQFDKALNDFNVSLSIDPENHVSVFNRGVAWLGKNSPDKAVSDFEMAKELGGVDDFSFYINMGHVWHQKGVLEKAIDNFDKAIELYQGFYSVYFARGIALYEIGKYEKAAADFSKAIKLEPNHFTLYYNRGSARLRLGKYDGAIEDFDKVLELRPGYKGAIKAKKYALKRKRFVENVNKEEKVVGGVYK